MKKLKSKRKELFETPVYLIEWEDAHTVNETLGKKEVKQEKNVKVKTTGYLIDEDKDRIAICGFRFGEGENAGYRDTHFIPKKLIKRIVVLEQISKEEYKKSKELKEKCRS